MQIMKALCGIAMLAALPVAYAAELQPDTRAAWDQYVEAANSHMRERLHSNRFLWLDETPDLVRRVRRGEVVVSSVGEPNPKRVPNGLIHHWIGDAFIPNAGVPDIFAVVQDFSRYKEFYTPLVVDSKLVERNGSDYRFSMVLLNSALFSKTALNCECMASYFPLDRRRWYGVGH